MCGCSPEWLIRCMRADRRLLELKSDRKDLVANRERKVYEISEGWMRVFR